MAADAARATVTVAHRINGNRNISRGISESSSPRISRNSNSISRGISSNNSSISRGISESSSPRNSSIISSGTSNISNRSRKVVSEVSVATSAAARIAFRGMGPSRVCFRCGKHEHFLSEWRAVPPTRFPDPYTDAKAATYLYSEDYAEFGSGPPPSQSAPAPPDLHGPPGPSE